MECLDKSILQAKIPRANYRKLIGDRIDAVDCLALLLERELGKAILRQRNIVLISRYFPNPQREFPPYLRQL
ncbi:MAG: hypothetical protein ACU4EQ_05635 [Candidatus Nitrosoglobus sp.]|jgi:hypothetical protein